MLEHPLGSLQSLLHGVDVVDHDATVSQLRLQLRHDVHAVDGDVLQGSEPDGHGGVQGDQVDGRNAVELGVGQAARAELGRRPRGGDAAGDSSRRQVVAERGKARDVLTHGQHPRPAVGRLVEIGEWFEVLGHVDQPTTIYTRVGRDSPAPQGFDQPVIAAASFEGRSRRGQDLRKAINHDLTGLSRCTSG